MNNPATLLDALEGRKESTLKGFLNEILAEDAGVAQLLRNINKFDPKAIRAIALQLARMNHIRPASACWQILKERQEETIADRFASASLKMQFRGLAVQPGHYHRALEDFVELSEQAPSLVPVWLNIIGYWLNSLEPVSVWRECVEKAIGHVMRSHYDPAEIHYLNGIIKESLGQHDKAVENYLYALNVNSKHSASRMRLAWPDNWSRLDRKSRIFLKKYKPVNHHENSLESTKDEGVAKAERILRDYGVVIIRGLIPEAMLNKIFEKYNRVLINRQEMESSGIWSVDDVGASLREELTRLLVESDVLGWLNEILRLRFSKWEMMHRHDWHIQWRGDGNHTPTPLHQDHPVYMTNSEFITCWFSCNSCGGGEAPGLDLYLENFNHPIHFVEQFPDAPAAISSDFASEYLSTRSWRPQISPGDVLLFYPKIFHRTEIKTSWNSCRMSCDVRFQAGPTAPGFVDVVEA